MDDDGNGLPPYVTSTTPAVSRADVGLRSERGPILLAVMLSVGLITSYQEVIDPAPPAPELVGDDSTRGRWIPTSSSESRTGRR